MTTQFEILKDLKKVQDSFLPSNLTKHNSYLINYQQGLNADKILNLVVDQKAAAKNLIFYHHLTDSNMTADAIKTLALHFSSLAEKLAEKGYNTLLLIREYNEKEHATQNRIEINVPDHHAHFITVKHDESGYDLHILKLKSSDVDFLYQETKGHAFQKCADEGHKEWKDIINADLNEFIEQESHDIMINLLGLIADNKGFDLEEI